MLKILRRVGKNNNNYEENVFTWCNSYSLYAICSMLMQ